MIDSVLSKFFADTSETKQILRFLRKISPGNDSSKVKILEVGCGFGQERSLLRLKGFNVLGVDTNLEIVKANVEMGLNCISVDQFKKCDEKFDLILMSHVIEHFAPQELLHFMDNYLNYLQVGGHLVICTPLLTKTFYDDFDHVKPYQPRGIEMVFGTDNSQVQYYSKNKLSLKDIWFRRSPYRLRFYRAQFIKSFLSRVLLIVDILSTLAFKISFGLVGYKTGWIGLYEKVQP